MSLNRIQVARQIAFLAQSGKCYYCDVDMWESTLESKWDALLRLLPEKNGILAGAANRALKRIRCSAEHLHRQVDGGSNQDDNIVAACCYCNSHRGTRAVEEYKVYVQLIKEVEHG